MDAVVLVRCSGRDSGGEGAAGAPFFSGCDGALALSASGVLLTNGLVVTSFAPFARFLHWDGDEAVLERYARFEVATEEAPALWRSATLEGVDECSAAAAAMARVCRSSSAWKLGWLREDGGRPGLTVDGLAPAVAAAVVVLDVKGLGSGAVVSAGECMRGDTVRVIGSPYGVTAPALFANCLAEGIVSNVLSDPRPGAGPALALGLLDARVLPGMEGGAVIDGRGALVGIVSPPLRRTDDSVALNSFLPVADVLQAVSRLCQRRCTSPSLPPLSSQPSPDNSGRRAIIAKAQRSLVLVKAGVQWASGILISRYGHVATNAHVFRTSQSVKLPSKDVWPSLSVMVRVDSSSMRWYRADVLFISESALDMALLRLHEESGSPGSGPPADAWPFISVPEGDVQVQRGRKVMVLGHALFGSNARLLPTATGGVIAAAVRLEEELVQLQTDAAVHKGNSGGMLLDASSGALLGMVTFNATAAGSSVTIPRLNFSIPARYLRPFLDFVQSNDNGYLAPLSQPDRRLSEVWGLRLGATPPALPPAASQRLAIALKSRL